MYAYIYYLVTSLVDSTSILSIRKDNLIALPIDTQIRSEASTIGLQLIYRRGDIVFEIVMEREVENQIIKI